MLKQLIEQATGISPENFEIIDYGAGEVVQWRIVQSKWPSDVWAIIDIEDAYRVKAIEWRSFLNKSRVAWENALFPPEKRQVYQLKQSLADNWTSGDPVPSMAQAEWDVVWEADATANGHAVLSAGGIKFQASSVSDMIIIWKFHSMMATWLQVEAEPLRVKYQRSIDDLAPANIDDYDALAKALVDEYMALLEGLPARYIAEQSAADIAKLGLMTA